MLDRLADPQVNCVREEQAVAAIVNGVESDRFTDFLTSDADLFEKCFNLRSSKKKKKRNVTCCLREILQQPSKREILLSLSGKELAKLLLALGQPGFDGKKKTRQVEILLSSSHECIIKYPDKVDR